MSPVAFADPPITEDDKSTPARPAPRRAGRSAMRLLRSRELALGLLVLVVAATLLGTLLPQRGLTPPADYELWQQEQPRLVAVAEALGLTAVYSVWWFLTLLGLLFSSLLACTANRVRGLWLAERRAPLPLNAAAILRLKHCAQIVLREDTRTVNGDTLVVLQRGLSPVCHAEPERSEGEASPGLTRGDSSLRSAPLRMTCYPAILGDRLTAVLRRDGYGVRVAARGGGWRAVAAKNTAGAWGSVVLHLGLLVILAGGVYSGATKAAGYFELVEGQAFGETHGGYAQLSEAPFFGERHQGFRLRLERLQMEFWPDGSLRDIRSAVNVFDGQADPQPATIKVNGALVYRGVTIYQSQRYGFAAILSLAGRDGRQLSEGAVNFPKPPGSSQSAFRAFRLPATGWQVLADFHPAWGERAQPEHWRLAQPPRPALYLTVRDGDVVLFNGPLAPGERAAIGDYDLTFVETRRWAGFPVLHDGGIGIVFAGFALCIAGAALCFLRVPRRLWLATAVDSAGRPVLCVGGRATKYQPAFGEEFAALVAAVAVAARYITPSATCENEVGETRAPQSAPR